MNSYRKLFLVAFFISLLQSALTQTISDRIALNQVGYYSFSTKLAFVTGDVKSTGFYITSTNLRDTVFTGQLGESRKSGYSSTKTRVADFSGLQQKGSFVLVLPGVGHSYVFRIGDDVFAETAAASLKGFYFQRMSMPLQYTYAGKWQRSAGHPDDRVYVHPSAATKQRPANTVLSSPGGWYDAGDYNKYIVNSGITMGTLLSAYEDFSTYYDALKTNIPESGDAIPDLLNEVLYNLRWMLTMQDPDDGGVYHKCTNAAFDGFVMPGVTNEKRWLVQKGTAATLDFAAVMAQASRIFKRFSKQLPGLHDSCLNASVKAWSWALQNPDSIYSQKVINQNWDPDITTGEYGDSNFKDEWVWAGVELYITTNDRTYFIEADDHATELPELQNWGNVAMMGYYSMARFPDLLSKESNEIKNAVRSGILDIADSYLEKISTNAFQTVMGYSVRDFVWGSNAVAANQGILLVNAWKLTKDKKYLEGALSNLDYLLGRNATGYCFLTGIGSKSPMHPHHRPSESDGVTDPVPGLLVGGPNPGRQDKCSYPFTEPETAYVDIMCSYASNEIAINWNAPMVYLSGAMEALKKEVRFVH